MAIRVITENEINEHSVVVQLQPNGERDYNIATPV